MNNWIPSITAEDQALYKTILDRLDEGLITKYKQLSQQPSKNWASSMGAMGGVTGELLYLFYSSLYRDDEQIYDVAFSGLERLVADFELTNATPSHALTFCSGLSGFLWSIYHLENTDIIPGVGDMIDEEVIDVLYEKWIPYIAKGEYDYMHAGLSIAMPLIESKSKTDKQRQYLENIVNALDRSAQRDGQMAYWHFMIDLEKPLEKGISLGLSHGMPAVIAILSKISQQDIATEKANALIEQVLNFIFDKKVKGNPFCLYPSSVHKEAINEPHTGSGRIAWCYGDIDIAIALFYAAKALKKDTYTQEAHTILEHIIRNMPTNERLTTDGGFCHGAAGNGHLFNRLYNYTGNIALKDASNFWFHKMTERIKFEENTQTVWTVLQKVSTWSDNTNVIMGTSGIGLSLISAISDIRPDWDDMFLLNI